MFPLCVTETLNLTANMLIGNMPQNLDNLVNLKNLDLSSNSINDILPEECFQMESLQELILSNNSFYGTIPQSYENFQGLDMYLDGNRLSGVIPPLSEGSLLNLEELLLNNNQLSGTVSDLFCQLKTNYHLEDLWTDCESRQIECDCCTACF